MTYPSTAHRSTGVVPAARWALALTAVLWAAAAPAQTTPQPAGPTSAGESSEVIKLSPFEVSTSRDYGYRASNSIAGTRTDTPIRDVPINIQVFTKDFTDDLVIKNQVDMEAYNAALVYGAADKFSDNVIQQPYQNFLFRGFRQNWGLRDGIREYDPINAQGLARVEVVKGPAAALYGLAYPGGVMNNISKTVDFTRNFTNVRLTGGSSSTYVAAIDANYTGRQGNQQFGVRFNGVNERTGDVRAHSKGDVKFDQVVLEWRPTKTTQAEFIMENSYRAKPNGLGANSNGNTGGSGFSSGELDNAGNPLSNHADIPIYVSHPEIPWDWNWSNGQNPDSLDTHLYRGTITQQIGENFQVRGYMQYSTRLEINLAGWDANGSGGTNSWEAAGSGYNPTTGTITSTYHYRDWGNKMHSYGVTAVYKLDFGTVKNTFAFGGAAWAEKEQSRASAPYDAASGGFGPTASLMTAVVYQARAGVATPIPVVPPFNLVPEVNGGPNGNGYHHENNSNDYYFGNWQASFFEGRLKTNIGINKTNIKLVTWNNGASAVPDNLYKASKWSPLFGAVFDITKEISVFAVHSTSLFPDSTKDSFGNQFSPLVGSSVEGGLKVEMMEGKISGTVSYYHIKQTGGTQSTSNHDNLNTATWDRMTPEERVVRFPGRTRADLFAAGDIIAGGLQEAKGIDLDVTFQPIRNWQILFSYSHVNHRFVTSSVASSIGETYPQAIKDRYALLTRYEFTQGGTKGLSVGLGISGGSRALMDYQSWNGVDVARYDPARMVVEAFATYKLKLVGQNALVQLNIKNLTKTPDYAGWKATGSSSILATERYKVPMPIVWRVTLGFDF